MQTMNAKIMNTKFEWKGKTIHARQEEPTYTSDYFDIYETFFNEYLIKVYKHESHGKNKIMAEKFLKVVDKISGSKSNVLKFYDQKQLAPHTLVLMEGYLIDTQTIIRKNFFCEYRDLYKFIYQVCQNLVILEANGVSGFHMNDKNIVHDSSKNYIVTHFDLDLNDKNPRLLSIITDLKNSSEIEFAPEFFKKDIYTNSSNVWDLGVLMGKILLQGQTLDINYKSKQVVYDEAIMEDLTIIKILKGCLEFKEENRIKPADILSLIEKKMASFNEISLSSPMGDMERDLSIKLTDFSPEIHTKEFTAFIANANPAIEYEDDVEMVEILLKGEFMIDMTIFEELVGKCWTNTDKLVNFYTLVNRRIKQFISNDIIIIKTLIILHSFIHKSSKNALIVFLPNNKNVNILEDILKSILNHAVKDYKRNTLIYNYASLLLKKVHFHSKYIKIIENNFSITKKDFVSKCERFCSPEIVKDLLEYIQYNFLFINYCKKYKKNYFERNINLFIIKEYSSAVGLFVNIISLIKYLSTRQSFKGDEKKLFNQRQEKLMDIMENNRRSLDLYVQDQKKRVEIFGVFRIERDLKLKYLDLCKIIDEQKKNFKDQGVKPEFEIKYFYRNYMNYIMKIVQSTVNVKTKNVAKNPNREQCRSMIKTYLATDYKFFKLSVLKNLPNIKNLITIQKFYDRMQKALYDKANLKLLGEKRVIAKDKYKEEEEEEEDEIMNEENLRKSNMNIIKHVVDTRETFTQVNFYQDRIDQLQDQKEILKEELEKLKNIKDGEVRIVEKIVKRKIYKNKTTPEETPVEIETLNKENLEKFLMSEFRRSVNEWIVNYDEIKIDKMISNSETSKVYRGSYKNIDVAIKKITNVSNTSTLKFLKEFKREVSILVSLPAHSSLLNLIGFCVHEKEVYLLTEYCSGGSLFDVLYRKSLNFKLNYAQKLKILIEVAKGLQFLHELRIPIIHRDLKSLK